MNEEEGVMGGYSCADCSFSNSTAYGTPFLLTPRGRVRVALRSIGGGYARWEANAPRVFDGSFSVRLNSGSIPEAMAVEYSLVLSVSL